MLHRVSTTIFPFQQSCRPSPPFKQVAENDTFESILKPSAQPRLQFGYTSRYREIEELSEQRGYIHSLRLKIPKTDLIYAGQVLADVIESRTRDGGLINVLIFGDTSNKDRMPIVGIRSTCIYGEIFGDAACDCRGQTDGALIKLMYKATEGYPCVLFYMRDHDGRGEGAKKKAYGYAVQEEDKCDTYEAYERLGFKDKRNYGAVADWLHRHGMNNITLLGNNPEKVDALEASGITVVGHEKLMGTVTQENLKYLMSKAKKGHHDMSDDDLIPRTVSVMAIPYCPN